MFYEKNEDTVFYNIYLSGHGLYSEGIESKNGYIADFSKEEFFEFIKFCNTKINTNLLSISTCYGGGIHASMPYGKKSEFVEKTHFPIIIFGTTESTTFAYGTLFEKYFRALEENKSFEKVVESLFDNKYWYCSNFPFLRPANENYIVPLKIYSEKIGIVNYISTKSLKKEIDFTSKEEILISPNIIPVTLKILYPSISSVHPGSAIHYIENLYIDDSIDSIKDFIEERLIMSAEKALSTKIFIFKKITDKKNNFFENVICVTGRNKKTGELFFKEKDKYFYVAELGNENSVINEIGVMDIFKKLTNEIDDASKLVGFLDSFPDFEYFGTLPGQGKSNPGLIMEINSGFGSTYSEREAWSIVWAYCGFEKIDLSINDKLGNTILHKAAMCGHTKIIQVLIDNGADINLKNNAGKIPFQLAEENNYTEAMKLLK